MESYHRGTKDSMSRQCHPIRSFDVWDNRFSCQNNRHAYVLMHITFILIHDNLPPDTFEEDSLPRFLSDENKLRLLQLFHGI